MRRIAILLAVLTAASVSLGQNNLSTNPSSSTVYQARDAASFAAAWADAYAFTKATCTSSTIQVAPGNYSIASSLTEPACNGAGISIIGSGITPRFWTDPEQRGAPWPSFLTAPQSSSIGTGELFKVSDLTMDCAPAAR